MRGYAPQSEACVEGVENGVVCSDGHTEPRRHGQVVDGKLPVYLLESTACSETHY